MQRTPPIPENCQWCTFLRNHDELTLEMVTEEERQWMWKEYAPEPRMKLNLGIRRRLAPLLDNDRRKIELANSLLFTCPARPSLLRRRDRHGRQPRPVRPQRRPHADAMGRFAQRRLFRKSSRSQSWSKASWLSQDQRRQPDQRPRFTFNSVKRMIAMRKKHEAFGSSSMEWVDAGNPHVAVYLRQHGDDTMLIFNNLSKPRKPCEFPKDQKRISTCSRHPVTSRKN
jgi:maltose alpha-D-glucosyltransferase / alpha-amylase